VCGRTGSFWARSTQLVGLESNIRVKGRPELFSAPKTAFRQSVAENRHAVRSLLVAGPGTGGMRLGPSPAGRLRGDKADSTWSHLG
jgi:hypothetical protein